MRKHLLLLIFSLVLTLSSFSQKGIYYKVKFLKTVYNEVTKTFTIDDNAFNALKDLFPGKSKAQVIEELNKNPFVLKMFEEQAGASAVGFSSLIGSLGNLDVTNLADGLAKFLVNRTKEELSVAFFKQFKEDLNSSDYKELQIFFPETQSILNLIDQKIYQFSSYLTELRDAFIIDINNVPFHLPDVLDLAKYDSFFSTPGKTWIKPVIKSSAFILDGFLKRDSVFSPGNLIDTMKKNVDHFFPVEKNISTINSTINGSVKTIGLISASFRSMDTARYWVPADSIKQLFKDTITAKLYLGLVYAQAGNENIRFSNADNASLQSYMRLIADNGKYKPILDSLIVLSKSMREADLNFLLLKRRKQSTIKDSLYRYQYALYSSTIKVLDNGINLIKPFINPSIKSEVDKYSDVFKNVSELYLSIRQQKYTQAILYLTKLSDQIIKPEYGKNRLYMKFARKLSTYGTFIAEVGQAENSDQVEEIISKTVLPTGSSFIKKQSVFNISLNAYTGIYAGKQRQATDRKFVTVGGVYAPVGVALSWGIPITKRSSWSVSLFASIIDIGPLVSYRFSNYNDTLANDVNVRLAQIVSPGGHLVIGLPRWPISLGGGFNWSPLITKVEKENLTMQPNNESPLRWEIFAAVDIPLLNFYNKRR